MSFSLPRHGFKYSRHKSGHVADTRHETGNHAPTEVRPMHSPRLGDDRTNSLGSNDAPNEEDNARGGCDDRFQRE